MCQLVHIISIRDANGNRMNFIWNVLNWKRDLVIQKLDFTGLVKHTLKREATSWKLNEHVIYNRTQRNPYSSLSRRASALEMIGRTADSTSVIGALGFFRVSPIFPDFPRVMIRWKNPLNKIPFPVLQSVYIISTWYVRVDWKWICYLQDGYQRLHLTTEPRIQFLNHQKKKKKGKVST